MAASPTPSFKNHPADGLQPLSRLVAKLAEMIGFWQGTVTFLLAVIILTQVFEISITPKISVLNGNSSKQSNASEPDSTAAFTVDTAVLTSQVLPEEGVILPITWGDLGKRMVADGVIDEPKFRALFEGGLTNTEERMLSGNNDQPNDQPIVLTRQNSRYLLDLLWAFGLANKNDILENGEMTDKQYGGAGNFASTGGWSLAKGVGIDHYSQHAYVVLNDEQQALVDKVSRGIFRPCCGNSTHFPDCNHGMAMLGLLELMAKDGASEQQMYDVALKVSSFWFPQTYIDLATYFKERGQDWDQVDAKTVLSSAHSSARGYQQTRQKIHSLPKPAQGGGGCGT